MAWAKGRLFSGDGGRDGSRGGERRGRGVMGMVLGHIFNHVTKTVHAWETRLCFSNPAGRLRSTLLRSTHSNNLERNKSDFYLFFLVTPTLLLSGEARRKARKANNKNKLKHWVMCSSVLRHLSNIGYIFVMLQRLKGLTASWQLPGSLQSAGGKLSTKSILTPTSPSFDFTRNVKETFNST